MRLIDADELAKEIEEEMKNGFPANETLSLYAIACIAHAPTVDVLEQIRAEISDIAVKTQNEDKREGLYIAREIVDRHR